MFDKEEKSKILDLLKYLKKVREALGKTVTLESVGTLSRVVSQYSESEFLKVCDIFAPEDEFYKLCRLLSLYLESIKNPLSLILDDISTIIEDYRHKIDIKKFPLKDFNALQKGDFSRYDNFLPKFSEYIKYIKGIYTDSDYNRFLRFERILKDPKHQVRVQVDSVISMLDDFDSLFSAEFSKDFNLNEGLVDKLTTMTDDAKLGSFDDSMQALTRSVISSSNTPLGQCPKCNQLYSLGDCRIGNNKACPMVIKAKINSLKDIII